MISPRSFVSRIFFASATLLSAFSAQSCLGIEEIPATPYIITYKPVSGYVEVDLSTDEGKVYFTISEFGDERGDQELYHRVVVDYRQLSGSSSLVEATYPQHLEATDRNAIGYMFPTCQIAKTKGWNSDALADKTVMIYFVLADASFKDPLLSFDAGTFSQAFATDDSGSSTWVSWTLHFNGSCPASL